MDEVEIKFRVGDVDDLRDTAERIGFRRRTPSTFERNVLFDTPERTLRQRGELLRLRQYGERWVLTHKRHPTDEEQRGRDARHKLRVETETVVADGEALDGILASLGYKSVFTYEKFREEWSDGEGHFVIDRTPLGPFAELEGTHEWIDRVAAQLGVSQDQYVTDSYGMLFLKWKQATGSGVENMSFAEMGEGVAV